MIRSVTTLIFFWVLTLNLSAQEIHRKSIHQQQVWFGYFLTLKFSEKWFLISDLQHRAFMEKFVTHQDLFRSRLQLQIHQMADVSAGPAVFITTPADPEALPRTKTTEYRVHEEASLKQLLGKVKAGHRLRVEQRWIQKIVGDEPQDIYNFSWRFRYRFLLEMPLLHFRDHQSLILRATNEIMFNAGKSIAYNIFDQNRFSISGMWELNKSVQLELGYIHVFQERSNGFEFYNRNILFLNLHHKITV